MDDASSDSAAIAASIDSPAAFALIFDRHFDAVHAYLQRRIGPDLADELAAQTFLVAFDNRARYERLRANGRPWLFGIATNFCSTTVAMYCESFAPMEGPGATLSSTPLTVSRRGSMRGRISPMQRSPRRWGSRIVGYASYLESKVVDSTAAPRWHGVATATDRRA